MGEFDNLFAKETGKIQILSFYSFIEENPGEPTFDKLDVELSLHLDSC
jgi:hypothetical protein